MKALNIAEDARISNLQRVITAAVITEEVPPKTAKRLRDAARAVRLYTEAGERRLANSVLTQVAAVAPDLSEDTGKALIRHIGRVREYWRFIKEEVQDA